MQFQKSKLVSAIILALTAGYTLAETQLAEIRVIEEGNVSAVNHSEINASEIGKRNPSSIKTLFNSLLDVDVNSLQRTRAGNEGINIRGLQGNRVGMSIDGIPLPESQENKLFATVGMAFGRGDFIEPTSLQTAQIQRGGSSTGLSGSVNFTTLEPDELLKGRALGGLLSSAYNSVDQSVAGTLGFAAQNEKYQGLLLTTYRQGHESQTNGDVGGVGSNRTEANPADYKSGYVLVKNYYQLNDKHRIGVTFEHLQRETDSERLSELGSSVSRSGVVTNNISDHTNDKVKRNRLSLSHQYADDNLLIDSSVYFQSAQTDNHRRRYYTTGTVATTRLDDAFNKDKTYGIRSQISRSLSSALPQILRYGVAYSYQDLTNQLITTAADNRKPSADTKQSKLHLYVEDEITLGNVVLTPHLGILDYRLKPSAANGYVQRAENYAPIQNQHKTVFLPKFSVVWNIMDEIRPYAQYSRGFKAPSAQQLTTSFGNSGPGYSYSIVGNPKLKPETADNFEVGFKGNSDRLEYRVAGFYNRYKNFIDYLTQASMPNMIIQYENIAKAKIYGVDANLKWAFWQDLSASAGISYARGKATEDGVVRPINSVQPLKLRAGLAYESEQWGANLTLTHVRAKADKDIDGTMYNPSISYNLVDLGAYWQPVKNVTLSASVNNLFDKKYWNWSDISYLAGRSNQTSAYDGSVSISNGNADAYTAPGRNFNLGIRYAF
ncbi:TonB-dependent hemoglobin/transferrin/lactoferrin family receptor [Testudinibacter sp. P27/CKL/0425]